MHGIVVAGTHSGCGKTTVTLGLLAALKKKGFSVQAFKAGPDFIDAGLHRLITGRSSRNLDLWMCGKEYVRDCFRRHSCGADISIIEGVMGLYDGGLSTAALSVALGLPVVLVIDAYGMAESGGAVAKGFMEYGICEHHISPLTSREGMGKVCFLGVIFNRAASENHYRRLTAGVRDIPVLGCLPRDPHFEIPHRHLGLSTAEEEPMPDESLYRLAGAITRHIDLDALVSSAARLGAEVGAAGHADISYRPTSVKIAVARDRAFCFYYEDNLDLLRKAGAEIVFFSPLTDTGLPGNADCVYIGGGYPEIHAERLSHNRSMLRSIRDWIETGRPLYSECGGLMYLCRGIHDFDGNFFGMAGAFPFETVMRKGRSHLGYREVRLMKDCILGGAGSCIRGHEFHYSELLEEPGSEADRFYSVRSGSGDALREEGYVCRNALASYIHIHFGSNQSIADDFVNFIIRKRD